MISFFKLKIHIFVESSGSVVEMLSCKTRTQKLLLTVQKLPHHTIIGG